MSFESMNPIFVRVVANCSSPLPQTTVPAPFLVQVCGTGNDQLRVIASDFQQNTFQAIKSRQQLEDLRDDIGIGGSWSEFVDYITTSLRSGDVKLVMEGVSESAGAACAKLIAQKAKGLPKISLHLGKVVGAAAAEATANLALDLYKEFMDAQGSLVKEQQSRDQLTKIVAAEQVLVSIRDIETKFIRDYWCPFGRVIERVWSGEDGMYAVIPPPLKRDGKTVSVETHNSREKEKSSTLRKQLDMVTSSRKGHAMKISSTENLDSSSALISQDSPDKHAPHSPSSKRGTIRAAPAHRRSKVRGAVLHDTADDA